MLNYRLSFSDVDLILTRKVEDRSKSVFKHVLSETQCIRVLYPEEAGPTGHIFWRLYLYNKDGSSRTLFFTTGTS